MIDTTPSRTTGTFQEEDIHYIIYYGPKSPSKQACKIFFDEDKANEFFQLKQKNGLHVEAYKEVFNLTRTISKLT